MDYNLIFKIIKMKKYIYIIALVQILFVGVSCTELDLVPLDQPTTSPFTSVQQFREGLNEGYREGQSNGEFFYPFEDPRFSIDDDSNYRTNLDRIKAGTLNADDGGVAKIWANMYKAIARIVTIKNQILNQSGVLSEAEAESFLGEANFLLANYWSYMVSHFGDVPYYEAQLSVEEAFEIGRTDKATVLQKVYDFYDSAITSLPVSRSGLQYANKGAAMAMKARIALYMGDFAIAAEAAQDCMELDEYDLHPNFGELFKSVTRSSEEFIFYIPRDESKGITEFAARYHLMPWQPRTISGGFAGTGPTWQLLASYECVDGLPIDESPLFDPVNPFKNRDPRCLETIVAFGSLEDGDGRLPSDGTRHMGLEYTPHPERTEIFNYTTNSFITNQDTKSATPHANYAGLLYRKFIDEEWEDRLPDGNRIIMRYADVLLMYAEAKIELNQIDDSVLAVINEVRDRAYANSNFTNPRVTTTDQSELRYIIRNERRSEFAMEGLRYMDIIRWRLAEKVLSGPYVALLSDGTYFSVKRGTGIVVKPGLWFWSETPELDEDGYADFMPLVNNGFASVIATYNFDASRQYLYPVPTKEILLAPNLLPNNPNY